MVNVVAIGSVLLSFLWVLKVLSASACSASAPEHAYLEHYFTWIQSGSSERRLRSGGRPADRRDAAGGYRRRHC